MSRSPTASSPPGFNPGQSPNLVFSRPRAPSPYMKSLLTYIDAVNNRDFKAMDSVFDDALEHRILPKSLERPVLTKKQYGDYWRSVMSLFEQFETKVHEVIEAGDKMTVHASSKGVSLSGTPYSNEYVLMIHFVSPSSTSTSPSTSYPSSPLNGHVNGYTNGHCRTNGAGAADHLPKIRFLKEFVDSGFSTRFFKEERERQRKAREERAEWGVSGV